MITTVRSSKGARRRGRSARLLRSLICVWVAIGLQGAVASAEPEAPGFLVVVHPSNPLGSVEREFLVRAFLKATTRWPGDETIRPVDQTASSRARKRFSERILRRSIAAIKNYWHQRIFAGRSLPPPELDSDDAVLEYVLTHRGAVGYVSSAAELGKAKPLVVR
jgi:ABC-type phosphate transport system substrate-binding protein